MFDERDQEKSAEALNAINGRTLSSDLDGISVWGIVFHVFDADPMTVRRISIIRYRCTVLRNNANTTYTSLVGIKQKRK